MPPLPPFHLHPDVLLVLASLALGFWWAEARLRPLVAPGEEGATSRQRWWWTSGLLVMALGSSWPVHDLAEDTLITFHMLEHMLIGYVVPVLLLLGIPRWMADRTLGHRAVGPWLRPLSRPVPAFFLFNLAIVAVHVPQAVAWQNTSELTHLAVHAALFATGILLWLPVFSPTPAVSRVSRPIQVVYLFLNTVIPIVPASFLTFSDSPLYPVYGDAALSWGLTPVADQTIAGLVMKLGGGFYLLGLIAGIWFRWIGEERAWDGIERELARDTGLGADG